MKIDHAFLQTIDWSRTPLGPMAGWPRSLKGYVDMILGLPTPAIIFWGPLQTQIYNDGYALIMGPRHPKYFGAPYRECWPETSALLTPWMDAVLAEGKFFEVARSPITMMRLGFPEEAHFSFTFSALRDDEDRIAGIYQPVVEMTELVLQDRRTETLRVLSARRDPLESIALAFDANANDLPFAGLFTWNEAEGELRVAASSGFTSDEQAATHLASLAAAAARAFASNTSVEVAVDIVARPWPEPVRVVFVTPLRRSSSDAPVGVIAIGISPRLRFDDDYRAFLEAVAREIGTSIAAARAQQREEAARNAAEASRAAQARRMAMLFEHAPVGIAVLRGANFVFEVANPLYAKLVDNRPLLGRPIREALPEFEGQGIFELIARVFETGEPFVGRSVPLFVERADGVVEERFFEFAYQLVTDEAGKSDSIIVVVFEVTELSRARRDAEAASRAKDEFFAILGHELRNPLAPITTALQLMRMSGGGMFEKERMLIERQVAQITRLVDDLLDVSRITRGIVTLKREPVEIAQVVTKAIETASPLLEQRHHHLEVGVAAVGLVVEGDPVRLEQVVANLLTNAAKYTEPGGRVRVSAAARDTRIVLEVTDTGIGIGAEMLPRVFDAFAQERQALDRAQGGLGLGLTIVANLVKLHGGTVSARSEGSGKGSTFTVELPASTLPAALDPAHRLTPIAVEPSAALRVLVVDDNEDAAEMLAEALDILGYVTRVAHDGVEALGIAEQFDPDVAVLDIGLPMMDGYELAARLRAMRHGENLRLVAVTGYGQDSDRARTRAAGFDAHLVKPVELDVVATLIGSYAGLKRSPV